MKITKDIFVIANVALTLIALISIYGFENYVGFKRWFAYEAVVIYWMLAALGLFLINLIMLKSLDEKWIKYVAFLPITLTVLIVLFTYLSS